MTPNHLTVVLVAHLLEAMEVTNITIERLYV